MSQNLLKREKVVGRRNPILNSLDDNQDQCLCTNCNEFNRKYIQARNSLSSHLWEYLYLKLEVFGEGVGFLRKYPWNSKCREGEC